MFAVTTNANTQNGGLDSTYVYDNYTDFYTNVKPEDNSGGENLLSHFLTEEEWLHNTEEGRKELARRLRLEKLSAAAIEERGFLRDTTQHPYLSSQWYFDNFADVLPECLRYWARVLNQKAWRGFNKKTQPYRKYFDSFVDPYFYTLTLDDLTISKKISRRIEKTKKTRPDLDLNDVYQIYLNASLLKSIVRDNISHGAAIIKIEGAGLELDTYQVHLHVVAERDALCPHLKRLETKQSGKCTPVYEAQGLMAYLLKGPYTVKRYDPDNPASVNEATLKFAVSIEAKHRYLNSTGKSRVSNLLDFFPAKRLATNT